MVANDVADFGKTLTCAFCENPIQDPINKGAVVWELVIQDSTVLNTGFRVTHRLPHCIQRRQQTRNVLQWRPISDFYIDGEVNFACILQHRYDEFGYRIDWDAEFDKESIENVYFRLCTALETVKPQDVIAEKPGKSKKKQQRDGYVYLVQSASGLFKIGHTANPENRMKTFAVKLPFEVEYVCIIATEDRYLLERELHRKFASKRKGGEFFALDPDDVEYIRGLAK